MNIAHLKLISAQRAVIISIAFMFAMSSLTTVSAQQQREAKPPLRERLFFGGNFGLQFGTITNIQIAPVVGLWVLPRLSVAAGPEYTFYKDEYSSTNIYGAKFYSEFILIKDLNSLFPIGVHTGIFFHFEDEYLNLESAFWNSTPDLGGRFYLNTLLIGGGISQQLGVRSSMNFTLLWALNPPVYTVYSNPEIRITFNF